MASPSLPALSADGGDGAIVEGEFREAEDSGPVAAWLDEVEQKLLDGGGDEDGHLTDDNHPARHARNSLGALGERAIHRPGYGGILSTLPEMEREIG